MPTRSIPAVFTLPDVSIYDGVDRLGLPADSQGWNSTAPIFARLIDQVRPQVIVEVGSWKGASAIHMARCCQDLGLPDWRIYCVDTWLGSPEIWANPNLRAAVPRRHGYPELYFQFLHNVQAAGFAPRITPLPMTSHHGAIALAGAGVVPDLVYIDGAHEAEAVYADLEAYHALLRPGGVIFGDDISRASVLAGLIAWGHVHGRGWSVEGEHWIIGPDC